MFRILFLLFFALNASFANAAEGFAQKYTGAWQGVGVQTDGSNWSMRADISQYQGVIEYPNLACGGYWFYQDVAETSLTAIETIQYGLDNCIETGNVRLQPYPESRMLFMWCGEEDGVSAIAVLSLYFGQASPYQSLLDATLEALETVGNQLDSISCSQQKWLGV